LEEALDLSFERLLILMMMMMMMFGNKVLRETFGPKRDEVSEKFRMKRNDNFVI